MDEELMGMINSMNQKNQNLLSAFSPTSLIGGFIFGVIGIYLFRKGKKETDYRIIGIGIALMIYPLLVSSALLTWGIGAALCALAYYWTNN